METFILMLTYSSKNVKSFLKQKERPSIDGLSFLAAELGFEPRQTESESVVLTVTLFGNIKSATIILTRLEAFVKRILRIFHQFTKFSKNIEKRHFL